MDRANYEGKAKANHEKIYKLHMDGMNKKEIAKETGYSEGYVDFLIRKMKGPSERRVMSDSDKNRIMKLRKKGKTLKEIASEIGYSLSAVQRCLKEQKEIEEEKRPEEVPCKLTMANRIPQVRVTYINGKRYQDVSEFYLGV